MVSPVLFFAVGAVVWRVFIMSVYLLSRYRTSLQEVCRRSVPRTIHNAGTLLEHSGCSSRKSRTSPAVGAAGMLAAWRRGILEPSHPGTRPVRGAAQEAGCARPGSHPRRARR